MKKVICSLFVFSMLAFGQSFDLGGLLNSDTPLPINFVGIGFGTQRGNLNADVVAGHLVGPASYLVARTKYSGSTSATTIQYKQPIFARWGLIVAATVDGGGAIGAAGDVGVALAGGGTAAYGLDRLPFLKAHPGYWVSASWEFDRRDVTDFVSGATSLTGLRANLGPFISKGDWLFTAGKRWGK